MGRKKWLLMTFVIAAVAVLTIGLIACAPKSGYENGKYDEIKTVSGDFRIVNKAGQMYLANGKKILSDGYYAMERIEFFDTIAESDEEDKYFLSDYFKVKLNASSGWGVLKADGKLLTQKARKDRKDTSPDTFAFSDKLDDIYGNSYIKQPSQISAIDYITEGFIASVEGDFKLMDVLGALSGDTYTVAPRTSVKVTNAIRPVSYIQNEETLYALVNSSGEKLVTSRNQFSSLVYNTVSGNKDIVDILYYVALEENDDNGNRYAAYNSAGNFVTNFSSTGGSESGSYKFNVNTADGSKTAYIVNGSLLEGVKKTVSLEIKFERKFYVLVESGENTVVLKDLDGNVFLGEYAAISLSGGNASSYYFECEKADGKYDYYTKTGVKIVSDAENLTVDNVFYSDLDDVSFEAIYYDDNNVYCNDNGTVISRNFAEGVTSINVIGDSITVSLGDGNSLFWALKTNYAVNIGANTLKNYGNIAYGVPKSNTDDTQYYVTFAENLGLWDGTDNGNLLNELPDTESTTSFSFYDNKDGEIYSIVGKPGLSEVFDNPANYISTYRMYDFYVDYTDKNGESRSFNFIAYTAEANKSALSLINLGEDKQLTRFSSGHRSFAFVKDREYNTFEVYELKADGKTAGLEKILTADAASIVASSDMYGNYYIVATQESGLDAVYSDKGKLLLPAIYKVNDIISGNAIVYKRVNGMTKYSVVELTGSSYKLLYDFKYHDASMFIDGTYVLLEKDDVKPTVQLFDMNNRHVGKDLYSVEFVDEEETDYYYNNAITNKIIEYRYIITFESGKQQVFKTEIKESNMKYSIFFRIM